MGIYNKLLYIEKSVSSIPHNVSKQSPKRQIFLPGIEATNLPKILYCS